MSPSKSLTAVGCAGPGSQREVLPACGWRWDRAGGLLVLLALTLSVTGCQVTPPQQKIEDTVHASEDLAATEQQIRIRIRALVAPFSGMVIDTADRIMAGTTNRVVRREALVWKIEAVPALREALFRPSPFVAVMDFWVLTFQMGDYFESGPGRDALGAAAPIAVQTCQRMSTEIESIAASMTISGDVSDAREFARKWASERPIQHSIASRESTLSRVTEREIKETFSTQEIAGNVVVTLDDLSRRLDVYSAQLPDQVRWQAELFAMDQTLNIEVPSLTPLVESAARAADRANAVMEELTPLLKDSLAVATQTPSLVTAQREAALLAIHDELARLTNFVQQERIAALQQLSAERAVAVRDIAETVKAERLATVAEMDRISLKVVDHAFWRAAQLLAVGALVGFGAAVILLFLVRRWFAKNGRN